MKNHHQNLIKKRKIIEKLFMGIIILLFLAFLILWTRTELVIARYTVGAVLLAAAFAFKLVDKKLEAECIKERSKDSESNET